MPKKKPRRLWLNVKAKDVTVSVSEFVRVLMESIKRGDYVLPRGWKVTLEWRNKESAPMRSDSWQKALKESAESSAGFDGAVTEWLRRKLK